MDVLSDLHPLLLLCVFFLSHQEFINDCRKEVMLSKYGSKVIRLSSANTYSYQKGG